MKTPLCTGWVTLTEPGGKGRVLSIAFFSHQYACRFMWCFCFLQPPLIFGSMPTIFGFAPPHSVCKLKLTSLHRMPFKPAIFGFNHGSEDVLTHRFLRVWPGTVSTRHTWPWHCAGWRGNTQVFLGVRGDTVRWPRTKGTAVNEWVHSFDCFVDFCLIPLSTTCSFDVPAKNL